MNVSAEFAEWWQLQDDELQVVVAAHVGLLKEYGPRLGRPYADHVKGSVVANLKELRIQHAGRPYRVLFAFDPRREAPLLIAGNKRDSKRWYVQNIRRAERIFARHIKSLEDTDG